MEQQDVAVVGALAAVEGKHALRAGTHLGDVGLTEGLQGHTHVECGCAVVVVSKHRKHLKVPY